MHSINRILKYADYSYLMIPSSNADTVVEELDHVGKWAETCNLKLNQNKTYEMLIRRGGGRVGAVDGSLCHRGI